MHKTTPHRFESSTTDTSVLLNMLSPAALCVIVRAGRIALQADPASIACSETKRAGWKK